MGVIIMIMIIIIIMPEQLHQEIAVTNRVGEGRDTAKPIASLVLSPFRIELSITWATSLIAGMESQVVNRLLS